MHANYRFASKVASTRGTMESIVEWDSVDLVVCPVDEDKGTKSNCPICLDDPVAARVSRCGHIACLPCILRYLDTGNYR